MSDGHQHDHDHQHGHGHANDQGLTGLVRYLRHAPRMWRSAVNDAVVDLAAPQRGESVLDIGAGMGAGIRRAAPSGAAISAVEPTPALRMILALRAKVEFRGATVDVIDGAAEKLGVSDGSIDAIWAVNTMHHWVDAGLGAAEIGRALKPGGRVVLVDEDFDNPEHPDHEEFGERHTESHHGFDMVDAAAMGELLRSEGLVDIEAGERNVAGRPTLAVLARRPDA